MREDKLAPQEGPEPYHISRAGSEPEMVWPQLIFKHDGGQVRRFPLEPHRRRGVFGTIEQVGRT